MKTFEQVTLAVGQLVSLLGCVGSVISFVGSLVVLGYCAIMSGLPNSYIRDEDVLFFFCALPILSIVGFLYSFGMWVVFGRVRRLP